MEPSAHDEGTETPADQSSASPTGLADEAGLRRRDVPPTAADGGEQEAPKDDAR